MRRIRLLAVAASLLAGTTVSAETLRIGLQDDPDVLDPHRARTFVGRIVLTSLCDKLVDVTEDLKFVPQLAASWAWSDAGRTLTFKLREGATFHDGQPLDAAAVKANLDRARALPDSLRKSEIASVASVEAPDATTVVIRLAKPDASLLSQLSDRAGMMLSPTAFAKGDFSRNPVCSGPYKFVERVQNDRIVLEKFEKHWDAANYAFDRVVFTPIPDSTVRLANLRAGDLDIVERVAPSDVKSVKADDSLKFFPVTGLGYQGLTFNIAAGPKSDFPLGKDKRVRKAFELSIDRDVINSVVGEGIYTPAYQPYSRASFAYDASLDGGKRDVEKARALLKEAGYERVAFELAFGNSTTQQQIFELIQAMAAEAGFDISLRPTEFAALQKALQQGDFQAAQSGWSGRVDPDGNIHAHVACKGGLNDAKYCNEEVDRLIETARAETDEAKRAALYHQAQKILTDELPVLYLFYQPWPFATAKKVEGFKGYPDGMIRLRGVSFGG